MEGRSLIFREGVATIKNYLKVLPLETWMKACLDPEDSFLYDEDMLARLLIFPPVLKRDGWYYDREHKQSWFEVNGKAYKYPKGDLEGQFMYDLSLLNHIPLAKEDLAVLHRNKRMLTKQAKEALYLDHQWWEIKRINQTKYEIQERLEAFMKNKANDENRSTH